MKKTTLIFILLIISNGINAQFSISGKIENVDRLNKICFFNNKIFLINASPNTLFTKDGGKNIYKVSSCGNYNNAVALSDSIFVTIDGAHIKITKDQGYTWNYQQKINDNGDTIKKQDFYDFFIYKNGKGFITNYIFKETPKVYITNNWGNTWNLTDTSKYNFTARDYKPNNVERKQYNFDSTSYAMKQSSDSILVKYMHYGDTATEINLANHGIIQKVQQIAFKDENNGMITTGYYGNQVQKIFLTNDGCKTFIEINKPNVFFEYIDYAKPTATKAGFYIGSFLANLNSHPPGTYYTNDDGKTWLKNIDSNYLWSLNFYDAETGIVTIGKDINFNTEIFYFTGNTTNISETENLGNKINIYPNPVNSTLNYSGLKGNVSFKILNIQGQLVLNGTSVTNQIDVSELQNGLYILNLETEEVTLVTKFIKSE